jgi:hypothetical protein
MVRRVPNGSASLQARLLLTSFHIRNNTITTFSADDLVRHLTELGALLRASVHDGASVGFVLPYGVEESEAFWSGKVLPSLSAGALVLFVARHGESIAGSVQADYDTLPNQRHRAEVRKLLVHLAFRRQFNRSWRT